jgi:hypothetical protein
VRIGAHVRSSGGISKSIGRAQAIGAETIQVFTHNPRTWRPISGRRSDVVVPPEEVVRVVGRLHLGEPSQVPPEGVVQAGVRALICPPCTGLSARRTPRRRSPPG